METAFIIQVTNVAPAASLDQMKELFGYLGKIKDIKLYPSESFLIEPQSKVCYIQYCEAWSVGVAQHLTNTVFIDRALIVVPIVDEVIPDESKALALIDSNLQGFSSGLSPVINEISGVDGSLVITTIDPRLTALGLPQYPPLPANMDPSKIEEIRRTVCMGNLSPIMSADKLLNFVNQIGEVKYVRMAGDESMPTRFAFVEFTDQMSVAHALQYNSVLFEGRPLKVTHSSSAIVKPQPKSLETAQKEIDEAMKRVKEAQSLITAAIEPEIDKDKRKRHRSRSRSISRHRSRSHSRRRKRSRSRSRRSRSRRRSRSSHRTRHRSRSESKKKSKKDRSRSRDGKKSKSPRRRKGRSRSTSRDKKKRHRTKSRSKSRSKSPYKSKSTKSSRSKDGSKIDKKKTSEKFPKVDNAKADLPDEKKIELKAVETAKSIEVDMGPPILSPELPIELQSNDPQPPLPSSHEDEFDDVPNEKAKQHESLQMSDNTDDEKNLVRSSNGNEKNSVDTNIITTQSKDLKNDGSIVVSLKSPVRTKTASPSPRRSPSPSDRSSVSPVKSKKSNRGRDSRSVSKARSVSPERKQSPSPVKKRTRSRSKHRSSSRSKKRSRSRSAKRSRSRSKKRSRSGSKKRSRSRSKHGSRSPRKISKRKKSRSPVVKRKRSRSTSHRHRSRSGTRSIRRISQSPRHSKRRSITPKRYSRSPKRYSVTPRRRSRTPRKRSRSPKRRTRSPSYSKSRRRSRTPPRKRGSRRNSPHRRSRSPRRRSRSKSPKRESKHKRRKSREDSHSHEKKKKDHSDSDGGSSKEAKVFRNYDEEEKGYDSTQEAEGKGDTKMKEVLPIFESSKCGSSSDSEGGKMDICSD